MRARSAVGVVLQDGEQVSFKMETLHGTGRNSGDNSLWFSSFVKTQFKEEIKYELRGDISTVNGVSRVVSYSESKCID